MSDNFDQHSAHRPTPSPSGARQDGHNGGSATSRATRSAARNPPRNCVSREGAFASLAETSSFMLQMYQMPQSPTIFDRKLLRARQQRARALGAESFLIDRVAAELGERLAVVLRQFDCAVDLGTPTDAVRRVLAASGKVATIVVAAPAAERLAAPYLGIVADEEALPFADGSLDLVASALSLQFVNDLPGTLMTAA